MGMGRTSSRKEPGGAEFFRRFSTDDDCLAHVMNVRFGFRHACRACGAKSTFHKLAGRKAYSCARCGDQLYPCAGTIFEHSRTPLSVWFRAVYLCVASKQTISAKELQRRLGVTYKCAHRMRGQIRQMLNKGSGKGPLF
jgi:hypothetical protein